jgi:hypothetical protein
VPYTPAMAASDALSRLKRPHSWGLFAASIMAGACGGNRASQECVPGDASRVDAICSPEGKWQPRPSVTAGVPSSGGTGASTGSVEPGASSPMPSPEAMAGSSTIPVSTPSQGTPGGPAPGQGAQGGDDPAAEAGEAPPGTCLGPGELACGDAAPCCDGAPCLSVGADLFCAAPCVDDTECASGCCTPVDETTSVCAPGSFCPSPVQLCTGNEQCASQCCLSIDMQNAACAPAALCAPPASVACTNVVLLANDGTFLGQATSNTFATDGVCNEFSQYGSQFAATSIFNEFGQYGGQFSSLSAYNQFTTTPPVLYCVMTDTVLNPVSKNTILIGAIDPDALCAVLAANGL